MVIVRAWHSTGLFMRNMGGFSDKTLPHRFNVTHFVLPVDMIYKPSKLHTEPEEVCDAAFNFFNWMTHDREGEAPKSVNDTASKYRTHASMSVGDIVEIQEGAGSRYFMVMGIGWKEVPICDERFDAVSKEYALFNDGFHPLNITYGR